MQQIAHKNHHISLDEPWKIIIEISKLTVKGTWREVADSARTTINLGPGSGEPSEDWKRKMLLAEHSPIRQMFINAKWTGTPYWVSVHFVRHKFGIKHWVRTQRTDRTGQDRNLNTQNATVEHEFLANYQAIINISRKRLCNQSAKETREAWMLFLNELKKVEPELFKVCIPECVYRGWCLEYKSCGFHKTNNFPKQVEKYRSGINI